MARRFNQAAGDYISFAQGTMGGATSFYTFAIACKMVSDGTEEVLFRGFNAGFTAGFELRRNSSNGLTLYHYRSAGGTVTKSTSTLTFTIADGWCVICVRVPPFSLSQLTNFHKTPIPNGTRVSESPAGVFNDFSTGITDLDIFGGDLDVACAGFWVGLMSDAALDLLDKDFISWTQANSPGVFYYALLWRFNQGSVAENVLNWYSNVYGCDQDGRSGTTVIADPTGFEMDFEYHVRPMVVV